MNKDAESFFDKNFVHTKLRGLPKSFGSIYFRLMLLGLCFTAFAIVSVYIDVKIANDEKRVFIGRFSLELPVKDYKKPYNYVEVLEDNGLKNYRCPEIGWDYSVEFYNYYHDSVDDLSYQCRRYQDSLERVLVSAEVNSGLVDKPLIRDLTEDGNNFLKEYQNFLDEKNSVQGFLHNLLFVEHLAWWGLFIAIAPFAQWRKENAIKSLKESQN